MRGKLFKRLIWLLFPQRCVFCNKITGFEEYCCKRCAEQLNKLDQPICKVCGKPLKSCVCSYQKLFFRRCVSAAEYDAFTERGVLKLKTGIQRDAATYFAALLQPVVEREYDKIKLDYILAVPMERNKRRRQGYNHAEEIAKELSNKLNLPFLPGILMRNSAVPLHTMDREERIRQASLCYEISSQPSRLIGKTILLVDDVVTTASTLNRCAELLLSCGAAQVYCAAPFTTLLK